MINRTDERYPQFHARHFKAGDELICIGGNRTMRVTEDRNGVLWTKSEYPGDENYNMSLQDWINRTVNGVEKLKDSNETRQNNS